MTHSYRFVLIVFLILFSLLQVQCADRCIEYRTYDDCIRSIDDQCIWDSDACNFTKNLELGCSELLNKKACNKQLAYASGELAKCIFISKCQPIQDLSQVNCQDSLSKHGCMSIQKTSELCEWNENTYSCDYVSQMDNLKDFQNKLYSASVCGRIEKSERLYRKDLGLQVEADSKVYETGTLKNNFVSSGGYFQWYELGQPLGSGLSNLKISDREREGCIALEIVDDNDYQMLFSTKIQEVGVNHIYCRYIKGIFTHQKCLLISQELQLQDQQFLTANEIFCRYVDRNRCSYINLNCLPQTLNSDGLEKEFSCIEGLNTQKTTCVAEALDTFRRCKGLSGNEGCYLNTLVSPPVCSQECIVSQQSLCNSDNCNWTQESNEFIGCVPKFGCKQPGVNQYYCVNMRLLCSWDDTNKQCTQLQDYQLNILDCNAVISKFSCGSIRKMGQECIWLDNEGKCINVLSDQKLKLFQSFPKTMVVNRQLCMYSTGQRKYTNMICDQYQTDKTCETEDSSSFNYELCLNTPKCQWDVLFEVCKVLVPQTSCDALINVSASACAQFMNCKYNQQTKSCQSQSTNLTCDDQGIKKEICLGLSDQPCKWSNGVCSQVTSFNQYCTSYNNVSQKVCVLQSTEKCQFLTNKCILVAVAPTTCQTYFNKYACQFSTEACYFAGDSCQTLSATKYETLTCEGFYLSKKACQQIINTNEKCSWDGEKCVYFKSTQRYNCLANTSLSQAGCISIISPVPRQSLDEYYCAYKFPDRLCASITSSATVASCGNANLLLNRQTCSQLTSGNCIFVDQQCKSEPSDATSNRYWNYHLKTITCDQANKNTCKKVQNRICQLNSNFCFVVIDPKLICSFPVNISTYNPIQYCANSVYSDNTYATKVRCKINSAQTDCEVPSNTNYYSCDEPGININICFEATYGQCAFINGKCTSDLSNVTSCNQLNKQACLNMNMECGYFNNVCTQNNTSTKCPAAITNYSWYLCSSTVNCYGILNGCKQMTTTINLKCDTPGVGKTVCEKSLQNCSFTNGVCKNISKKICEYEFTKEDCINNLYYNCVYDEGQCYTQNLTVKCDKYEYTNYKFCRQFPYCQYINNQCKDFSLLSQIENDKINYTTGCQGCKSTSDNPSQCPHLMQYSKMMCQKYENCDFQFGYYCVDTTQTLSCSQLSNSLCLSDISDSLACYWDGTNCQEVTTQICSDVQSYQTNYSGCSKISNQDTQKCMYQSSTQKCKILKETNNCSDFTTNIECAIRANASCLLANPTAQTTTCSSSSVFNANLNLYGCTQLTGNAYYYDIYNYQCAQLTVANYVNVQGCQYLNKQSCIEITSDILNIYCGWIDNQCQQLIDLTKLNDCTLLNKYACINIENSNLVCQWNVASHTCTSSIQTACYVPASIPANPTVLYSISLCSKGGNSNACMANSSNTGCVTFNYTIEICETMGLNKKACVEQTTGYCKWANNKCSNSQLDNLDCNSDVNKNTCLAINDNLCQWNDSTKTCSTKTLTNCSDATNYNQCMNVPNQFCQYTDSCKSFETIPKICQQGFNKYSCQNVTEQICQFSNNQCSILTTFDSRKECSKQLSEQNCKASPFHCIWQSTKCIFKDTSCYKKNSDNTDCYNFEYPCSLTSCTPTKPLSCVQIYNRIACLDSDFFCYWDNTKGCQNFYSTQSNINCGTMTQQINRKVCQYYASQNCEYRNYVCTSNLSDVFYELNPNYIIQSSLVTVQSNCSENLTEFDCVTSTQLKCYWNTDCKSIEEQTVSCTSKLNLPACQEKDCLWRQRKCISKLGYVFQPNPILDEQVTDCTTRYISKATCLNIPDVSCTYDETNNQCDNVTFDNAKACSDYQLVNKKTCQMVPTKSCIYDSDSLTCQDFNGTITDIDTLSKPACLSLNQAAYWDNGCHLTSSFQCDQVFEVTQATCKLVKTSCIYNQELKKCTSEFNINSLFCDSPGLSQSACTSILREPCIFIDGQCQLLPSNYTCEQARNVNELGCASLQDSCSYDILNKKCKTVTSSQVCQISGLSKSACQLNSSCIFNSDFMQCQCNVVATANICANKNQIQCVQEQLCMFDNKYNSCRRVRCEDLGQSECKNSKLNMVCFLNNGVCQSASQCEDIINVDHSICSQIEFESGEKCIGINSRCLNEKNYDLYCQLSDCSSKFCKKSNICEALKCSDLTNCNQLGNKCVLSGDKCVENISCQQLSSSQCIQLQLYNAQTCVIQQQNIYQDEFICTSQVCALFGSSNLCNGNQFNNFTCLLKDSQCLPCEFIVDPCTCSQAKNICEWKKNGCASVSCTSFLTTEICNDITRCSWSSYYGSCQLHCNLVISQEDCNARQDECYYDLANNVCQVGTYNSPDLSVNIKISTISELIIVAANAILIFYFI
ncbi:unnamed protein product [Paramecium octaurelia]|uniref:Uncharacterized protein n=1 Tax=Paramecium octaurelia TaxID=43137 RepID=A0A8S1S986_PAROT|nr:unnamed protein product [Paramecium octaurelia]